MSAPTTTAAPPSVRRRRPFRFPLIVLAVMAAAFLVPWLWDKSGFALDSLVLVGQIAGMVLAAGVLSLVVWFFVSGAIGGRFKLGAIALILLTVGLNFACVRQWELSGSWAPMPRFRWEPDYAAALAQHLREQPAAEGAPAVNLTVDPVRDFPQYRGLRGDGTVTGVVLDTDWTANPPREVWRHPVGGGYAGFAVAGDDLVTIEQRDDQEAVVCYDKATGQQRWVHSYPALFHQSEPMGGAGPRATPTIFDGDVYSLGATGQLVCLKGKTGDVRWQVNILEDAGAKNLPWGMSGSPLVYGEVVVVNPGVDPAANKGQAVVAYNRKTGKRIWAAGDRPAAYSSPQLVTLAGKPQLLLFDRTGLVGLDPSNGKELWNYPWDTMLGMNMIQPLVVGTDGVLVSSETSNGCALVKVRRDGERLVAEPVWQNKLLASKFSNPVQANGSIYGLGYGILTCLDAETGKRRWKDGRYGYGQILLVGDNILVLSESGKLALVAADPAGYRELGRLPVLPGKTWNTPALTGKWLFVRNHRQMACYELPVVTFAGK